ncbi:MAG: glycosyltransferase family 2 protein [Candidatus Omnitrophica bacterium]|nr:glycosyltransferase family 2 protein [Candidatus Omnitrophota bacterium]MDD5652846.1 glycosyltransferase family 2 protein [Candidatus Omnitrophota bacterium]
MREKVFPKISIVTPSFNQAEYLEETIKSVLSQNYPNLEYIIIDGGSTDGSVEIIRRYSDRISYWVSEPDKGRGEAINKGFQHATGEIMGWLGCGDKYFPWTFEVVSQIFSALPEVEWLTSATPFGWITRDMPLRYYRRTGFSKEAFFDGQYLPIRGCIQQESTFWKKSLWLRSRGHVESALKIMPDFELWLRFWQYATLYSLWSPLAGLRHHPSQGGAVLSHFEICRKILDDYYHNNIFSIFYHETRYRISRLPVLKNLIRYRYSAVKYDFGEGKWAIVKSLKSRS